MQLPSAARISTFGVGADPPPPMAGRRSASVDHVALDGRTPQAVAQRGDRVARADAEARPADNRCFEPLDGPADVVHDLAHVNPFRFHSVDRPTS